MKIKTQQNFDTIKFQTEIFNRIIIRFGRYAGNCCYKKLQIQKLLRLLKNLLYGALNVKLY